MPPLGIKGGGWPGGNHFENGHPLSLQAADLCVNGHEHVAEFDQICSVSYRAVPGNDDGVIRNRLTRQA